MSNQDAIFQDFTDALWAANDEVALLNVAHRAPSSLGFKWFAYLGSHENETVWISNYPRNWIVRDSPTHISWFQACLFTSSNCNVLDKSSLGCGWPSGKSHRYDEPPPKYVE